MTITVHNLAKAHCWCGKPTCREVLEVLGGLGAPLEKKKLHNFSKKVHNFSIIVFLKTRRTDSNGTL